MSAHGVMSLSRILVRNTRRAGGWNSKTEEIAQVIVASQPPPQEEVVYRAVVVTPARTDEPEVQRVIVVGATRKAEPPVQMAKIRFINQGSRAIDHRGEPVE